MVRAESVCVGGGLIFLAGCLGEPRQQDLEYSETEVVWTAGGHADVGGLIVSDVHAGALARDRLVIVAESGRLATGATGLVHLLDTRGEHLATIGRRGRGPGEYESIAGVGFGPDSLLWVTDPVLGRINWFSRSGEFIKADHRPRERARGSPWYFYPHVPLANGAILASAAGVEDADSIPVALWTADGDLRMLPAAALHSPRSLRIGSGVTSQLLSANPLIGAEPEGDWFFVLDRAPAADRNGRIAIDRYDSMGSHLGRTEIPYAARAVDAAVTDWLEGWARAYGEALPAVRPQDVLASLWIPDNLPPVQQAVADARGYWLRRERTVEGLWQRYDLTGNLLVNVALPRELQALAADDSTILGWERDSLLTPVIRKYRIRTRRTVPTARPPRLALHERISVIWQSAEEIAHGSLTTDSSARIVTRSGDVYEVMFGTGAIRRSEGGRTDSRDTATDGNACGDPNASSRAKYSDVVITASQIAANRYRMAAHRSVGSSCIEGPPTDIDCPNGVLSVALGNPKSGLAACSLGEVHRLTVDAQLRIALRSIPADPPGDDGAAGLWYGLPILPLDTGYLRVFADLRSDHRRLQWLNTDGVHHLLMELDDPIGFLDSDPVRRRLLALRAGNPTSITVYEWRWLTGLN